MEDTERLTFCKEKKENKTGFSFVRFEPAYFFFKHRSKNTSSNLPNSVIGYKGSLTSFFLYNILKGLASVPRGQLRIQRQEDKSPLRHKGKCDHHFKLVLRKVMTQ